DVGRVSHGEPPPSECGGSAWAVLDEERESVPSTAYRVGDLKAEGRRETVLDHLLRREPCRSLCVTRRGLREPKRGRCGVRSDTIQRQHGLQAEVRKIEARPG